MFCPNCGTLNEDQAFFCGSCGTKLKELQVSYQQSVEQPVAQSSSYYQVQSWSTRIDWQLPRAEKVPGRGLGIASLVLGIVAVALSLVWVLSAACSAMAVVLAVISLCKADRAKQSNGVATAGLVCALIGVVLALFFGLVWPNISFVPDNAGLDRWVNM